MIFEFDTPMPNANVVKFRTKEEREAIAAKRANTKREIAYWNAVVKEEKKRKLKLI